MRVGILFSGGKDSAMALYWAQKSHEPACLITINSENKESYMFHTDKIRKIPKLAERVGLPLVFRDTEGKKEEELEDLKTAISEAKEKFGIEAIVSGAIESNYQKSRVDKICRELSLRSFTPLWHANPRKYLEEIIDLGFKVEIVRVAAEGLLEDWVGKIINKKFLKKLLELNKKYGVHIAGEGGEYETFVKDGPVFHQQ